MQMQQPVLPAQQAGTPTAMQAQNPVMPVQQAAGMQQAMVMQMQQPPSLTMPQSLMSVQQQAVMPPGQQSAIMHGHQPTTLQLKSHQQQQQAGGVGTPLSNIKDSGWVKYMMKVYYYRLVMYCCVCTHRQKCLCLVNSYKVATYNQQNNGK